MALGPSILSLLGRPDPRDKLMRVMAGGDQPQQVAQQVQPQVQYPDGGMHLDGTTTVASQQAQPDPVPQQPQQAEAYTSPDDLMGMYKELLDYSARSQNIDRGIGLLGSAFAQPENRAAIMSAFGGGDATGTPDPMAFAKTIMDMRSAETARVEKAAMMAQIPAIAKKYGIDEATARMLFQNEQLDDFVTKREEEQFKINNEKPATATNQGQTIGFDPRTGKEVFRIGVPDKPKLTFEKVGDTLHILDDEGKTVRQITNNDPDYLNITDTDGTTMIVDKKNPTKVIGRLGTPKDMTATDDTKEYDRYVRDTTATGGKPITFQEWQLQKQRASATNVTVNNGGQKEFDKKLGEEQAKRYTELQQRAESARQSKAQYDLAEKALDTGLETGFGADAMLAGRKIGDALGFDVDKDKVAAAETLKSVSNQLAMLKRNPESGMGLPGSVSDRDLQFLKDADIQIGASEQGNRTMIKVAKRMAERNEFIALEAAKWVEKNGSLNTEWDKWVKEYADSHPLFEGLEIKQMTYEDKLKAAKQRYKVPD